MKWFVAVGVLAACAGLGSAATVSKCHPKSLAPECSQKIPKPQQDCVPGTSWTENCSDCHCQESGIAICTASACAPKPPQPGCVPGTTWMDDCNHCRCSEYGFGACTAMACNVHPDKPIGPQPDCVPGTTWMEDCNHCRCSEYGFGSCTAMACNVHPDKPILLTRFKRHILIAAAAVPGSGKECATGTTWHSRCNTCTCEDGLPKCTDNKCAEKDNEPEQLCAPESNWINDCNSCWCSNGHAACTQKGCLHFDLNTIPTVPPVTTNASATGKECAVGTKWMNRCNQCTCGEDGRPVCGVQKCGADQENEPEQMCAEESSWKDDCNSCWCSKGRVVCTKMACGVVVEMNFDEEASPTDKKISDDAKMEHNLVKRAPCKPNGSFQSECNTCVCAADGLTSRCTQNECMDKEVDKEVEVFMQGQGVDHIERHSVCRPWDTFYIGCNTCNCNDDGTDFSCTNKPCPLPDDVELFHELQELKSSAGGGAVNASKIVCVANRMFVKDCNTCWCNGEGTGYFCTRKVCVPELPDEPEDKPENSSLDRKVRAVQAQETPKNCQPDLKFRLDCNTCLCDPRGERFSCTRMDCNTANGNGNGAGRLRRKREVAQQAITQCVPGTVFEQGCNVCRCTADGRHANCTLKRCTLKPDEKEEGPLSESDPSFRCNPGEQFRRDCNDCTCSADGRSIFCTLRLCDEDLVPSV